LLLTERDLAPSSRRVYALALGRLGEQLAPNTPLSEVTPRTLAAFMAASYPHLAPASWNRVVATLGSFFAYTTRQGWTTTSPAAGLERRRLTIDRDAHGRARSIDQRELLAFLAAGHPLREKTLWWMLYESATRADEILALNVADLDLPRRRAVVLGKGGRAEQVGWDTKTARLLPRLVHNQRGGPLFLANITPVPARQSALADIDPDSGRDRLSYRRRRDLPGGQRRLDAAPTTPLPAHPPRRGRSPAPDPHVQQPLHQDRQPRALRQTNLRRRSHGHRGPRPGAPPDAFVFPSTTWVCGAHLVHGAAGAWSHSRSPGAPALVERALRPGAPDVLRVADITYVRAWEGERENLGGS
jgi:integrase